MATTYYLQQCPTCGRRLQIRVEYMGRNVICYHCSAQFVAIDPELAVSSQKIMPPQDRQVEEAQILNKPAVERLEASYSEAAY